MKDATTGKRLDAAKGTDWERLRSMSDAEVHAAVESDPDARPTNEDFWKEAKVVLPRRKEVVTIRLDADLLDWLKQEPKYQTKINAILRSYMQGHVGEHHPH